MNIYFAEKQIQIKNSEGETLEFFMRPIKIKELKIIGRVSALAENADAEEFTTPLLLSLMLDCLSIDRKNIPAGAAEKLIETFIDYNFPSVNDKGTEESDRSATKKKPEPLSFFIDFLVNQGHSISDITEMTIPQFNDLILRAGERLNPSKKVMDPLEVFRKMGLPIRRRASANGK